jgi:hypothetical protein
VLITQVGAPGLAGIAYAAPHRRASGHPFPDREPGASRRSDLLDDPDELVTDRHRTAMPRPGVALEEGRKDGRVKVLMQVGTA